MLGTLLCTQVVAAAAPAAAATCQSFPGPSTGVAYTVTVCLESPAVGSVLSGVTDVTASATVDPPGAAVVDRMNFWWGPGTSPTYLLADHDAPYRMVFDTTRFPNGTNTLRTRVVMAGGFAPARVGGLVTIDNPGPRPPDDETFEPWAGGPTEPGERVRMAFVGDGVDGSPESHAVSDLLEAAEPDVFAYLGDVYDRGTAQELDTWYEDPDGYGRFTDITNPAVGNHEYMDSATAAPYFEYWHQVPHYYSYDVAGWHVVVLDSTVEFAQVAVGTPQYEWLKADLEANRSPCTLAYMHHARRTGVTDVNRIGLEPEWDLLVDHAADLVISGHAHTYERWTPMDGEGVPVTEGLTQFVVGTGGRPILNEKVGDPRIVDEVTKPGALFLDLGETDAQFSFETADGSFTDAGTVPCRTAPDVQADVVSTLPGDDGWHRGDVTLTWTATDPESPVTTTGCEDVAVTADQPETTYTCTATSGGGVTTEDVAVKRDGTAPSVVATVEPDAPDGANDWYVHAPTVGYTCADALSGVARCPDPVTAQEGTSTVTRTGRDRAGNTVDAVVGPLRVDLTDPTVTCDDAPTFLLHETGTTVGAAVTDAVSGPARDRETVAAPTTSVGAGTATVEGSDVAGRTGRAQCGYRVVYGFEGWADPVDGGSVNVVTAGRAVPVKWRLLDASGSPVTTLGVARVTSVVHACDAAAAEDPLEETAAGGSGLQNLGDGYYQYNWKTPAGYAGSCRTMRLDLGDTELHTAEFRFA